MAASNAELEARVERLEQIIDNAVVIPSYVVPVDDIKITDKTGMYCIGVIEGKSVLGLSAVAQPTLLTDFSKIVAAS